MWIVWFWCSTTFWCFGVLVTLFVLSSEHLRMTKMRRLRRILQRSFLAYCGSSPRNMAMRKDLSRNDSQLGPIVLPQLCIVYGVWDYATLTGVCSIRDHSLYSSLGSPCGPDTWKNRSPMELIEPFVEVLSRPPWRATHQGPSLGILENGCKWWQQNDVDGKWLSLLMTVGKKISYLWYLLLRLG